MAKRKISTSNVVRKEIKFIFNKIVDIPDGLITNEKIRNEFIDILKKSKCIPNQYLPAIWKLVDNQVIIPVNNKKSGFLSSIFSKLKNSLAPLAYDKNTLGFYSGRTNRIYLIIDNMLTHKLDNDSIALVLIHELQHMQCHNFPNEFMQLHKGLLVDFYTKFFELANEYTYNSKKIKVNRDAVYVFIKYIMNIFDDILSHPGFIMSTSDMNAYAGRMCGVYWKDSPESEDKLINTIVSYLTDAADNILSGKYWSQLSNRNSASYFAFSCMWYAYESIGMNPRKLQSAFGQELIFPSEVICMLPVIRIVPSLFAFISKL